MSISASDIIQVCKILAKQKGIRVACKESAKGGACAGGGAFFGGLIGGPVGIFVGSLIGGTVGYFTTQGKFKSAVDVIENEMSPEEKHELVNILRNIIEKDSAKIVADIIKNVINVNNEKIVAKITEAIINFLMSLGLEVVKENLKCDC